MTPLLLSLRSCFAELDDLKDANERAALYAVVGEHLRSASPAVWVEELEGRIAKWLEQDPHLREVAEKIRTGAWRETR